LVNSEYFFFKGAGSFDAPQGLQAMLYILYCLDVSRRPPPLRAVLRTGYSVPPSTRRC